MSDDKRIIVFLHNLGNSTRMYYSLRLIDGTYSNPTRITTGFDGDSYFSHQTYGARGLAISGDGKVIAINSNSSSNNYGGLGIFVDTSSTSTPTFTLRKKIHKNVVASNGVTINSNRFGRLSEIGNYHGAALSFDGSVIVTTNGSGSNYGDNNYILYSNDSWNTFNAEEITGAQTKSVAITSNGTIVLKDKNDQKFKLYSKDPNSYSWESSEFTDNDYSNNIDMIYGFTNDNELIYSTQENDLKFLTLGEKYNYNWDVDNGTSPPDGDCRSSGHGFREASGNGYYLGGSDNIVTIGIS